MKGTFAWLSEPDTHNVAIVGISKNSGKTTLLNHFIGLLADQNIGIFSTGIDGEDLDQLYHTPKPKVRINQGSVFCCDTKTLDDHGSIVTVVSQLQSYKGSGQLWLVRAEEPLQTEITGPSTMSDQADLLSLIRTKGFSRVLIDGSLDRKSIALSPLVDSVVMLIGASFGSASKTIEEIRKLDLLNQLPVFSDNDVDMSTFDRLQQSEHIMFCKDSRWEEAPIKSLMGSEPDIIQILNTYPEVLLIPGALTDAVLARITKTSQSRSTTLLFKHPICLQLSLPKLESVIQQYQLKVLNPFRIKAYVLNTQSIGSAETDSTQFRSRLRKEFPHLDLPDIREII